MLPDLLTALGLALTMVAGGCALLGRWDEPGAGERLVLAWALGAGLLGTLTLLVGLWRLDRWTLAALEILLLLAGVRPLLRLARALGPVLRASVAELRATPLRQLLAFVLLAFALLDIVGAETVVLDIDALRYHLAAPHRWLLLGVIEATPGIPFSFFPMLIQLTYAHALAWGSQGAPALLHAVWALLLAVGVYGWARRTWGPATALLAALLLLSLTDVSAESKLARIDMAVALYGWGAAICLLRRQAGGGHGWLLCAAALAGCAAASKYTGIAALAVTGALLGFAWLRRRERLRELVLFGAVAALVAAPWYVRNWLLTGNPLFPFAASLFGGPLPREVLAAIGAENSGYAPIARTPLNFLLTPLLLTFNQGLYASGRIGPLWLLFGPLWLLYRPQPAWSRGAIAWGLLFAPLWFWSSPLVRFLLPVLALWAALLAAVLARQWARGGWRRAVAGTLTAAWLAFALLSSAKGALPRLPVNLGLRAPTPVLDAAMPLEGPYSYADLRRAAALDGPLVLFDNAGFYFERPVTLAGDLGADPAAQLEQRFGGTNCGVVYLLLPDSVRARLDAYVAREMRRWMARRGGEEVYRRGAVAIYRVDGCSAVGCGVFSCGA